MTGFLGPNGAGKTTTLRLLLGLAEPTFGEALVFGRRFAELERPATRVGAVLDAADVHPGRTGRDHLRVLADRRPRSSSRVDEVLALVDLAEAPTVASPATRSGCDSAYASPPRCLDRPRTPVLDEPANGLDPEGIRWLRDFLLTFAAHGGTVLSRATTSPRSRDVDRVIVLDHGRLGRSAARRADGVLVA